MVKILISGLVWSGLVWSGLAKVSVEGFKSVLNIQSYIRIYIWSIYLRLLVYKEHLAVLTTAKTPSTGPPTIGFLLVRWVSKTVDI